MRIWMRKVLILPKKRGQGMFPRKGDIWFGVEGWAVR